MINKMKLNSIIIELKSKFRPTLVDRAVGRVDNVNQYRDDLWEIEANQKLGDYQLSYWVSLDRVSHKYECDCFKTVHGDSRRRRLCSHVVAVIIYRRLNKEEEKQWDQKLPRITGTIRTK